MQRCCVSLGLGVEWPAVSLARTKGRKPFATNPKPPAAPNFNFNVSHEGRYVALCSHPLFLVGVDVAAPRAERPGGSSREPMAPVTRPRRPLQAHLAAFRSQLADSEWAVLQGLAPDEHRQEAAFQCLWSLKEAFIKARGDGLGFHPLSRAAFRFDPGCEPWGHGAQCTASATEAQLELEGKVQPGWLFAVQPLPYDHVVSVALGPVAEAVDAYGVFRASMQRPEAQPSGGSRAGVLDQEFQCVALEWLLAAAGALQG